MRQLWRPPHGELPRLPQVPKRISGQENPPGNPTKPPEKSHRILHELADAIDLLVEAPPEPTYHDPRGHHADTLDIALLKNVPLQTRLHVVNALNLDHLPVLIHIGDETNDENLNTQVQCTNWPLKLNSKPGRAATKRDFAAMNHRFNSSEKSCQAPCFPNWRRHRHYGGKPAWQRNQIRAHRSSE
jgi:hypothetical protein